MDFILMLQLGGLAACVALTFVLMKVVSMGSGSFKQRFVIFVLLSSIALIPLAIKLYIPAPLELSTVIVILYLAPFLLVLAALVAYKLPLKRVNDLINNVLVQIIIFALVAFYASDGMGLSDALALPSYVRPVITVALFFLALYLWHKKRKVKES